MAQNTTSYLTEVCQNVDPVLNSSGSYFQLSKYLLIHHASELARRNKNLTAISLNPGYAIEVEGVPQSVLRWVDPKIHKACDTNFYGLKQCPQKYEEAAAVVAYAAVDHTYDKSGDYLDYLTFNWTKSQEFGPY